MMTDLCFELNYKPKMPVRADQTVDQRSLEAVMQHLLPGQYVRLGV